ncbi:hypothetical protein [Marinomonas sp. PE14-40]|uniref:hypothetical protein n=1 Tax=Marinomonas sp. PE14-40 TaxID=3060621 RepID=UPI003F66358C
MQIDREIIDFAFLIFSTLLFRISFAFFDILIRRVPSVYYVKMIVVIFAGAAPFINIDKLSDTNLIGWTAAICTFYLIFSGSKKIE